MRYYVTADVHGYFSQLMAAPPFPKKSIASSSRTDTPPQPASKINTATKTALAKFPSQELVLYIHFRCCFTFPLQYARRHHLVKGYPYHSIIIFICISSFCNMNVSPELITVCSWIYVRGGVAGECQTKIGVTLQRVIPDEFPRLPVVRHHGKVRIADVRNEAIWVVFEEAGEC